MGNLKEEGPGNKPRTIREQMGDHSKRSNCFACHGIMDPLGFALENFDAVGQYRSLDRQTRDIIDSSGKLPDGTMLQGPDDLRRALLAHPEQFVQTLTVKLMTYALGRPLEYSDMPTVRDITRRVAKDDYRFAALVEQIVASDEFQKTTPAHPAAPKSLQAAR